MLKVDIRVKFQRPFPSTCRLKRFEIRTRRRYAENRVVGNAMFIIAFRCERWSVRPITPTLAKERSALPVRARQDTVRELPFPPVAWMPWSCDIF